MKVKLLVTTIALATTVVPATGSASAAPPYIAHFKGRGAQAILTDCRLDDDPGSHCKAVEIFISDERYQERGSHPPISFVDVVVFDVLMDPDAPLGFIPTTESVGFSTAANVSVARNLSSASVTASNIDLVPCEVVGEEVICDGAGGTMTLDVRWVATGKRETGTFHERGDDFPLSYNFHAVDVSRQATASGEVDGQPLHETPFFPSSIFSTNNGVVDGSAG